MTDRWFQYIPNAEVEKHLAEGWKIVPRMFCHHDAYSCLMEEPPLNVARRILAECELQAAEAQTELHNARLAVLAAEDEAARALGDA